MNAEITPCNGKCFIDPETLLCVGCLRTPEEVAGWSEYTDEKKILIMKDLPSRKEKEA